MRTEFDPTKDATNKEKHGVSLSLVESFEMDVAQVSVDDRFDYKETRLVAIGPIGDDIYVLVYTMRGDTLRAISLRKANRREVLKYVDQA
jgi:uncharacterized protein